MLRHDSISDPAVFAECAGGAYLVEPHEPRVPVLAAPAPWPSCPSDTIPARMPPTASLGLGAALVNKCKPWRSSRFDWPDPSRTYPVLARSLRARRENIGATIASLEGLVQGTSKAA
jgi:hypothetical protein